MKGLFCFLLLLSIVLESILKFHLPAGISSIWNPLPGAHPVKLVKIWKQSILMMLRNLSLRVRVYTDPEGFKFDWVTSSDWSWHQSFASHWCYRTGSRNSYLNNFGAVCFLAVRKFWREMRCILLVVLSRYLQWHTQILFRESSQHLCDAFSSCFCLLFDQ